MTERPTLKVGPGWIITDSDGRRFLGQVVAVRSKTAPTWIAGDFSAKELEPGDLAALLPCYELSLGEQDAGNGQTALGATAIPFGIFGVSTPIKIRLGVTAFVEDLDEGDLTMVKAWVNSAENIKTQLRLARAGLAAVKPGRIQVPGR